MVTGAFGLPRVEPDCGIPVRSWLTLADVALAWVPVCRPPFLLPPLLTSTSTTTMTIAPSTVPPTIRRRCWRRMRWARACSSARRRARASSFRLLREAIRGAGRGAQGRVRTEDSGLNAIAAADPAGLKQVFVFARQPRPRPLPGGLDQRRSMPASPLIACKHPVTVVRSTPCTVPRLITVPRMSRERSDEQQGAQAPPQRAQARLRVAVIDRDPGFMQV